MLDYCKEQDCGHVQLSIVAGYLYSGGKAAKSLHVQL